MTDFDENVRVIGDTIDALRSENAILRAAALRALNFIENTEGEWGIKLESGDWLRAALAKGPA